MVFPSAVLSVGFLLLTARRAILVHRVLHIGVFGVTLLLAYVALLNALNNPPIDIVRYMSAVFVAVALMGALLLRGQSERE